MISFKLDKVLAVLLVAYFVVLSSNINNPHHADESTHAFVGLFLKDLANDFVKNPTLSFNKIYNYATSYLAYYPKVSLHYPFLPQLAFGIAYELLGVSLQVGRLVVILTSLALIILIYNFTLIHFKNRKIALLAASMMMTSSIIINMTILAMQEIPFVFLFTLTMLWIYLIKGSKPKIKNFIILSVLALLTILTKWQALTILPVIFLYSLIFQRKLLRHFLLSIIISAIILAPYYFLLWKTGLLLIPLSANLEADPNDPAFTQVEGWTYYANALVQEQFFLPMGIIILLTSLIYFIKRETDWHFFATWILVVYIIMVIVHNKDVRYTINILPAFVIPASYVIYKISEKRGVIFSVLIIALLTIQGSLAFLSIARGFPDVESIGKWISNDKEGNVLINTGLGTESPFILEIARSGNFDHQVFRPCTIEFINDRYDKLIDNFGIKYIVVDKENQSFTERQKDFNNYLLSSNSFILDKDFSRFSILKNANYTKGSKNEICNYVCATRGTVCTNYKMPSDALK